MINEGKGISDVIKEDVSNIKLDILKKFHDELIKNDNKLNVVKTYYSKLINKIVFELENGEILYINENNINIPNNKNIQEKIDLFDKIKNENFNVS